MYWHPLALGLLVLVVLVIGCGLGVVIGTQQSGSTEERQETAKVMVTARLTPTIRPTVTEKSTPTMAVSVVVKPITDEDLRQAPSIDQTRVVRWRAAAGYWEVIDTFQEQMVELIEDKVVDSTELAYWCSTVEQWRAQLEEVQDYVQEYREVEPTLVAETPRLHRLETEAQQALIVVAEVAVSC